MNKLKPLSLTQEQLDAIQPLTYLNDKQQRELSTLQEELESFKFAVEICKLLKITNLRNKSGEMPLLSRCDSTLGKLLGVTVTTSTNNHSSDIDAQFYVYRNYKPVKTNLTVFKVDYWQRLELVDEWVEKNIEKYQKLVDEYTYYVVNFNLLKAQKKAIEKVINEIGSGMPQCLRPYLDYYNSQD
jgi:hypothetical protein